MHLPFYKLSQNPLVFISTLDAGVSNITEEVYKKVNVDSYAYLFQYWSAINYIEKYTNVFENLSKYKHIKTTILCNTQIDIEILSNIGFKCILVHHNGFLDENIFKILPNSTYKTYNAIYNAQIVPFKRMELSVKIAKLGVITYVNPNDTINADYRKNILAMIGRSVLNNYQLEPNEVCKFLNQAKCGLILSEEEGGNYATTEYLLCGMPVITTQNIGGRDEFLNETNSIVVPADANHIAYIVNTLDINRFNANNIRNNCILKMSEYRNTFYDDLENIGDIDFIFINKLVNYIYPKGIDASWAKRLMSSISPQE